MQNVSLLFQMVEQGDKCLWRARLGSVEVDVSKHVNGVNEIVLNTYEMVDWLPCDEADCPAGKIIDDMSGPEIDTCAETCPFKTKEESLDSSFAVWGDEPLEALRTAIGGQAKRCKQAMGVISIEWVFPTLDSD
ncbi:hypothetical protein [Pseudomonas sp. AB12(2023)]|uniref:hypothetical protein n=1 Tax=Pseudomonas sp. AB12(2023) TaxID=3048597 RepID=UPI002B23D8C0|nr:hypothetical protein [Pseudomonas sp. AB12(2023)]MEB0221356.1 hypothetical protein [Pseudomonas sp. AB12(2023)]